MDSKLLIFLVTIAAQLLHSDGRTCYSYNYQCSGPGCSGVMQCNSDTEKCYSLYYKVSDSSYQAMLRGCWLPNNSECSPTSECDFSSPIKRGGLSLYFCCCTGDNCNSNNPDYVTKKRSVYNKVFGAQQRK